MRSHALQIEKEPLFPFLFLFACVLNKGEGRRVKVYSARVENRIGFGE